MTVTNTANDGDRWLTKAAKATSGAATGATAATTRRTVVMMALMMLLLLVTPMYASGQSFNLAGTARDFSSSDADFQYTTSTPTDVTSPEWASGTLDPLTLKPTWSNPTTNPSSATEAAFAKYWQTPFATMVSNPAATLPFSIQVTASGGLFEYVASPFYPFGTGNTLFTYEASTVFAYSASTLRFTSAGDMWIYMGPFGGALTLRGSLRGIHASSFVDITLSSTGLSGQVQLKVFYAHRSTGITPSIGIQVLSRSASYCNALSSPAPVANVYPFSGAAVPLINTGPVQSDAVNTLQLTSTALLGSGTSAYNANKQRLSSGFSTTFNFQMNNYPAAGPEGFAFIAQCGPDGTTARGGSSSNLGFNGVPKALVIEFDTAKDTTQDVNSNHVNIFYSATGISITSPLATWAAESSTFGTLPVMANGAVHSARIDYYPGLSTNTAGQGIIKVWVDNVYVGVAQIDDAAFLGMCSPANLFYVGFTASTSNTYYGNTYITNWRFNTVPTAASASTAVGTGWQTQVASNSQSSARQLYIQSADVCGAPTSGQGGGTVVATLSRVSDSVVVASSTSSLDNGDGTYGVWFWYSSTTTPVRLSLSLNGQQITGSPFAITITPAAASGATSTFAPFAGGDSLLTFNAGASKDMLVTLRDQFSNLLGAVTGQTQLVASFTNSATTILAQSYTPASPYLYLFTLRNDVATNTSLRVQVGTADLVNSPLPVTVNPGAVNGANSLISAPGSGLTAPIAGEEVFIQLTPRDQFGNTVNSGSSITTLVTLTPSAGVTVTYVGWVAPVPGVSGVADVAGYYNWKYTATSAGSYAIDAKLAGTSISGLNAYNIVVKPSTVNATMSVVLFDAGKLFVADTTASLIIQAKDQYNNSLIDQLTGSNFWVSLDNQATSGAVNTIQCGIGAVGGDGTTDSNSLTCGFTSTGRYNVQWKGRITGNYSISIRYASATGAYVGGTTYWTVIDPAVASAQYTSFVTTPLGGTAGAAIQFQMTTRDAFNNIRGLTATTTDDSDLFDVLITTSPAAAVELVSRVKAGATYTQTWRATQAGKYRIEVKLLGTYIVGGTVDDVVVIPAAINNTRTTVAGPGLVGGVQGSTVSIAIQARDRYGNILLSSQTLPSILSCQRLPGTQTDPATPITLAGTSTAGEFTGSYTVPTPYVQVAAGYFVRCIVTSDSSVIINAAANVAPSTDINYGVVIGSGMFVGRTGGSGSAGAQYTFRIQNRDNSSGCDTNPVVYTVSFKHATDLSAGASFPATLLPSAITTPCTIVGAEYSVTFALNTVGSYSLNIRAGAVVDTQETKLGYGAFVVGSGVLSGSNSRVTGLPVTVQAGVRANYTVQLYDVGGNPFTTAASYLPSNFAITYSSSAAGGGCVTGTIVSNGDGSFVIPYICSTIGTTQVETSLSGSTRFGGLSYSLKVIPNGPNAAQSQVLSSTIYTAGVAGKVRFNARDQYGNAVSELTTGAYGDLTITLAAHTAITFGYERLTISGAFAYEYDITFTPTNATFISAQRLTVFVAGVQIAFLDITIRPGQFDGPRSRISFPSGSYVAGIEFNATLTARDSFGNAWYPTVDRIGAILTGVSGRSSITTKGGAIFTIGVTVTTAGSGYGVLVSAVNTLGSQATVISDLAGNAPFSVISGAAVAGTTVSNSSTPSTISVVTLPSYIWPAGSVRTMGIRLRDQYQNFINVGGASVRVAFVTTTGDKVTCSGTAVDWTYNATQHFIDAGTRVIDRSDGTYWINILGTKAGKYGIIITVNGLQTKSCSAGINDIFTITPLGAYPANSLVDGTATVPSLTKVGSQLTIRVTMRDIYGNDVAEGGQTVLVGVQPSSPITCPGTNFLVLATSVNSTELFTLENAAVPHIQISKFVRSEATTFYLIVTVNGVSVTSVQCRSIAFTAGYPTQFAQPTAPVTYAAIPASFTLTAQDKYNNTVVNGTHYYTATFERIPDAQPVKAYSFSAVSVNQYPAQNNHIVNFLPAWQGSYTVTIRLRDDDVNNVDLAANQAGAIRYFNQPNGNALVVLAATCAATNAATPFRCPAPSYLCVATASACPAYDTVCAVNGYTSCNSTTCGNTGVACACPTGTFQCVGSGGHCVTDINRCPAAWNEGACAAGFVRCTTGAGAGECRQSLAECPTPTVCTSGFRICPDKRTCVATVGGVCPSLSATVCTAPTPYLCRNGLCAMNGESCGTGTSCGADMPVLCPDGTCSTTPNLCAQQYECYAPTATRCPDGTCRSTLADCPSTITCPLNWVRCPNNNCATSLSTCTTPPSCGYNSTLVRCPDGSCKTNLLFCGASITCPAATPVLCGDRSCVRDGSLCLRPPTCSDSTRPSACPDGSCAATLATCPTTITCPASAPVLCSDLHCATSVAQCTQLVPACPLTLPIKCVVDGSCRARAIDCPTATQCADATPVRCPDGKCAVAIDACVDIGLLQCPTGTVRCPSGECSTSLNLCPTHITCRAGTTRCSDGTCRTSCGAVLFDIDCGATQVVCPQAAQGTMCAASLENCPSAMVCPARKPVRCADQTCAATIDECPAVTSYSSSRKACPGGGWAGRDQNCGTPVTCPKNLPAKCWDETCRILPSDCPPAPACSSKTPFLCSDGTCQQDIYSCQAGIKCADATPVKCFAYSTTQTRGCVVNRDRCLNVTDAALVSIISNKCPDGFKRCRNGACAADEFQCPPMTCPPSLPVLCVDGLCARVQAECNVVANSCPWDVPYKCQDGACAASATECKNSYTSNACPDASKAVLRPILCSDGSCAANEGQCPVLQTGCPADYRRCLDGTCQSSLNGANPCIGNDDSANTCPQSRPYRCSNGYCALSSYLCPVQPPVLTGNDTYTCGYSVLAGIKGVRCADGSCRHSGAQCPTIRPCATGTVRCGDGSCAAGTLSPNDNACPIVNTCPTERSFRCPNGLCAVSATECISDDTNGCPANQYKCSNGLCEANSFLCSSSSSAGTGCTSSQIKCANGACVAAASECPASNGCGSATPFLCSDGTCSAIRCTTTSYTCATGVRCADGRCAATANACTLANGCTVTTPNRCADGTCKKYQAVDPALMILDASLYCAAQVTCPANLPYLCADNVCVAESKFCRPLHACTSGTTLCRDMVCRTTCDALTQARCPATSPVLCPSGACKTSVTECEAQTARLDSANPCIAPQVLCADGTCVDGWLACGAKTWAVLNTATFSTSVEHGGNATCGITVNGDICADGTCVPDRSLCAPVPRCADGYPWRCPDGSCRTNTTGGASPCTALDACATEGTKRCGDGYCRQVCLPQNGCSGDTPFYCGGKKSPCVRDYAACAAIINVLSTSRRLLNLVSTLDPPEACADGCLKNIPVIPQSVLVPYNEEIIIDIATDTNGISRTSLTIPSGALGTTQLLTVEAVATDSLDNTDKTFTFSQKVLSTPWKCSTPVTNQFVLNATVEASIDTRLYNLNSGSTSTENTTIITPCELQSGYVTRMTPNVGLSCSGNTVLSDTTISFVCDANTFDGRLQSKETYPGGAWDLTKSARCLCYNITGGNQFPVLSQVCIGFTRVGGIIQGGYIESNPSVCPSEKDIGNTTIIGYTPDAFGNNKPVYPLAQISWDRDASADACQGVVASTIQLIEADNICLGTRNPVTKQWSCLGGRDERLAYPTWSEASGRARSRVVGRISSCNAAAVYAFVNIDLPPPPPPYVEPFDWWAKWKAVVLGVGISVVVCAIVSGYAISRLIRYRRKYREKKAQLDQLTERAQDLDEYAGGLGIADEEVDMVANPLVVEMQELEKQVQAINNDMAKEGDENAQIDELERERQRIYAEIQKIKEQLEKDKEAAAAVRVSIDKGPVGLNTTAASGGTGSTQPARPVRAEQTKRHDFGDAKRPARKKGEE